MDMPNPWHNNELCRVPITDCQFNCTSPSWCHPTAMESKVGKKLCSEFWWWGWQHTPGVRPLPLAPHGEPITQPQGMYLHNKAQSVACPSLMKQIAWENDQADAWQLSHYITNPVLNTLYREMLKFVFHLVCASSPFHVERNAPRCRVKQTHCTLAAWKAKIITFLHSLWGEGAGRRCFCQPYYALALQAASLQGKEPSPHIHRQPFCGPVSTTHTVLLCGNWSMRKYQNNRTQWNLRTSFPLVTLPAALFSIPSPSLPSAPPLLGALPQPLQLLLLSATPASALSSHFCNATAPQTTLGHHHPVVSNLCWQHITALP